MTANTITQRLAFWASHCTLHKCNIQCQRFIRPHQ